MLVYRVLYNELSTLSDTEKKKIRFFHKIKPLIIINPHNYDMCMCIIHLYNDKYIIPATPIIHEEITHPMNIRQPYDNNKSN